MARVEVFVDDAVRGRLPNVCVKTGERADGKLRIEQQYDGLNGAWFLLLLLGPVGWVVLIFLALGARRSSLSVQLPYATGAVDHEVRLSRARWLAIGVTLLLGLAGAAQFLWIPRTVWFVAAIVAVVV